MTHDTHVFSLSNVSQAGLEPAAAAAVVVAALKFSQCNVLWGSISWDRGWGVEGLILSVVFACFL
jgi:hypothetical protein